jgi:hypothetical protein
MFPFGASSALWLGGSVAVAALGSTARGARLGSALAGLLLPVPFLTACSPPARLLLAAAFVWLALRALDLAAGARPVSSARRWLHLVTLPDLRLATSASPLLDRAAGRKLVACLVLGAAAALLLLRASAFAGWPGQAVRWLALAVGTLVAFEGVTALIHLATAAVGIAAPPVHDSPLRSRSVAEFWARRWNRVMNRLLHDLCFRPLARRGALLALAATFLASAAVHAYAMGAAAGSLGALSWGAFFLVQPLAIVAERRLRVRSWPPALGRVWTLAVRLALFPLSADPRREVARQTPSLGAQLWRW